MSIQASALRKGYLRGQNGSLIELAAFTSTWVGAINGGSALEPLIAGIWRRIRLPSGGPATPTEGDELVKESQNTASSASLTFLTPITSSPSSYSNPARLP